MTNDTFFDYPFRSKFFELPQGRMHYLDEGKGPVAVLVHGNPTWSYFYRGAVNELRKTHRVIAIDHLGCGLSSKPQNYAYTLANHIENLQALLHSLEVTRFSLVMHDWGGAIGMGVAADHPEQVERLVVLNTAAFRSARIPFRIWLCKLPGVGEVLVRGLNGFAWPATFMAVTKKMRPEVIQGYLAPYRNWDDRIATHRFVADIPMRPGHESYDRLVHIESSLGQFRGKGRVLVLWGGKDFCFNNSFYHRWLEIFPEAESYYFKDAGHYLLEDAGDEAIPLISSFLRK